MKNKKGFTLIEIMAVIIILAIIALIVVPLVTGSIKNSKDKLYETQMENIKSAAKSYMINLDLEQGTTITVTIEELKKLGLVDKDIKDPRTDKDFNKCLTVEVTNKGNIYEYRIIDDIQECDEVGSVIMTLIGSLNETVYYQKEYVDSGVILKTDKGQYLDTNGITVEVVQYKDGNIENTFTGKYSDLTSLIDTSDYYKYEITYKYEGPEGSASKVRNVEVKAVNNLQCLILPTEEKNEFGWITSDRVVMIMSINTDKNVEYSISETNEKRYSENQYLYINKDGNTQVYGYIRDEQGNEAACTSKLKFEVGTPSCNVNLAGTQSATGWYTSDVTANLEPSFISEIINKGISLNSTVDYNGESSMKVSSSGNVYGYIKDEAGKEARCSSNARIDKTTSILVSINGVLQGTNTSYTSGTKATSNIVLTGTVNPGTTASGYKYQWYRDNVAINGATGTSYIASTSGNYKLVVITGSGVTGVSNIINVVMETERPTCSLKVNSGTSGTNGWYTSDVTVGMSTTGATYYGTNSSYNMLTSQTLSTSGTAYCYVANSDKTLTNSDSMRINIDKTGPSVNLTATPGSISDYNTQSMALTATASDPESGINRYEFYNGSTLIGSNTTGVVTVSSLEDTANNYKVRVYNNAGLYSEASITETCSVNSSLSSSTCVNGSKRTVYTCTGTGRTYSITESCTTPTTPTPPSCGSISCPSGMYQCSCSCCGTPSTGGGSSNTTRPNTTGSSNTTKPNTTGSSSGGGNSGGQSMIQVPASCTTAECEKKCNGQTPTVSCPGTALRPGGFTCSPTVVPSC